MSERPQAPSVYVPIPDIKDVKEYQKLIKEYYTISEKLFVKIDDVLEWYIDGTTEEEDREKRAKQIFRDPLTHKQLQEKLDFINSFCGYDEIFTDYDEIMVSNIPEKANYLREEVCRAKNFFAGRYDPSKKLIHSDKLLLAFYEATGVLRLQNVISATKDLLRSYEKYGYERGMSTLLRMIIEISRSVKYPEGMKAELPSPLDEGKIIADEQMKKLENLTEELDEFTNEGNETRQE